MFHYFGTNTNTKGDSLVGWQVECVQLADGSTVIPIYADENSTAISSVSGVTNRALTDSEGNYDFFVEEGDYSLRFYNSAGEFQKTQRYVPMYGRTSGAVELRADLADDASGKGDALVASDDGSSGALWTTIKGFITYLRASTGSAIVGYTHSGAASAGSLAERLRHTIYTTDEPFGAVADDDPGNDQTATINTALATLDADIGGIIFNPRGVHFTSTSLVFPKRGRFYYYKDDDLSQGVLLSGGGRASNELCCLVFNANDDGAVNEIWEEAPFSLGRILNLRDDLTGHEAFLSATQVPTNPTVPARLHEPWARQDNVFFRRVFEQYRHYNVFSGIYDHCWRQTYVLTGVGTDGWTGGTEPVANETLEGVTSGARMILKAIDATTATGQWLTGRFQVGETVRIVQPNGGSTAYETVDTSTGTISGAAFSRSLLPYFGMDLYTGRYRIGHVGFGYADEQFEVDGNIKVSPSDGSRNSTTITDYVGYIMADSPARKDISDHNQVKIAIDLAAAKGVRVPVVLRKLSTGAWVRQGVTPITGARIQFTHHATAPTALGRSENVADVETLSGSGAGIYRVNFTNDFTDAYYKATATLQGDGVNLWTAQITTTSAGSAVVRIWNDSGTATNLPGTARVDVEITHGIIA